MKRLSERQLYERTLTEEDVLGACRALLELNGARVFRIIERIPWGRKTSEKGLPDIFGYWMPGPQNGCDYPKVFFIEVKRPGGKHRPAQTAWIENARRDGVIAFFADSVMTLADEFKKHGIDIKGLR